jgi:hypothetical protein
MQTLYARINTGLLVFIALTGIVLVTMMATRSSAGPLDPSGTPAPTMKTLQQVEPRTPIDHLPFAITQTGSYYLTGNLSLSADSDGIVVTANHVTVDLNGFQLVGTACLQCTGDGIVVPPGTFYGLTVRNGTLGGWNQAVDGSNARQAQFSDLVLSGNAYGLSIGESSDARRINASYNTNTGVQLLGNGSEFADSEIFQNSVGIRSSGNGSQIHNVNVAGNTTGGILALGNDSVIANSILYQNSVSVQADGQGGQILNNEIDRDTSYGILMSGSGWRVESNHLFENSVGNFHVTGLFNVIERNSGKETPTGSNTIVVGNYAPFELPPVTNPLSNIDYPGI